MPIELATLKAAASVVGEKVTEAAAAAKSVEGVAAAASLASKLSAVAEQAAKELPKEAAKSAVKNSAIKMAEEMDDSIGDAVKVVEGAHYAKSTISNLNAKFIELSEKAREGFPEFNTRKDAEGKAVTDLKKSNSTIEIDGRKYDTDDNGNIFKVDGYELLPQKEYIIDGSAYKTDDRARIILLDTIAKKMPDGERDNIAQMIAGGADRRAGDQGGHILARVLGGSKGIENMIAMRGTAINQSVYKRMENEIGRAVEDNKKVPIHTDIDYRGDSERPSRITVTYSIDGKERIAQFDNDEGSTSLLSGLEKTLTPADFQDLGQEVLDAKEDGHIISVVSVKEIFDEGGNTEKVIVTMRDESSEHPVNEDRVFNLKEGE